MHSDGDAFTSESTPVSTPVVLHSVHIFITRNEHDVKHKEHKSRAVTNRTMQLDNRRHYCVRCLTVRYPEYVVGSTHSFDYVLRLISE